MRRTLLAAGSVFDAASCQASQAAVVLQGDRIVDAGAGLVGDDAVGCRGKLILPGIEHGTWLDERAVAAMADSGSWLVPRLSVTHGGDQVGAVVDRQRGRSTGRRGRTAGCSEGGFGR